MSSTILDILGKSSVVSKPIAKAKPKSTNKLDYGSIEAVNTALLNGSTIFKLNLNFKKNVPFGLKQHLSFFGGSLKCRDDLSGAFANFIPESTVGGKHLSAGTSYVLSVKQKPSSEQLAQIAMFNEEAKQSIYASLITETNYDYEDWQAFSLERFGSSIGLEINVPNWNADFVEALSDARDADPEEMIRSMSLYLSFDEEDGASFDLNKTELIKPKEGAPFMGKVVQPRIFACFFFKEIFRSARFEGSVSRQDIAQTVSDIAAMKEELAAINAQATQSSNKKGNKAVSNAKLVFETRLETEGVWNSFVETELMELAKSSQFPGWSLLAAKVYFSKLSAQYPDAEYTEEHVSIRNTANAVKSNPAISSMSSSISGRLA